MADKTEQTITQSNLAAYTQPYVEQMLGKAQAAANVPYTPYSGQQVAGFNPLQTQAFGNIQQMQPSQYINQAAGLAGLAGAGFAAGSNYNPVNATNQYTPAQLASMNMGYDTVTGAQGQAAQMAGPQQFTGQNVQQYMTPYLQTAQNQAIQNYANQLPQLGSAATQAGGLGGSREALMQAMAQQGLQQTLAGNVANAFSNAQQQFNTSQQQQLQSGQANLAALMQAEQQNVGNRQQAGLANQQAGLQTQAQKLQQETMLNQLGVQQAQNLAQYGQAAQSQNAQQQQFGAGLNQSYLQGLLQASGALGQQGQNQYGQSMGINEALLNAGKTVQGNEQTMLNTNYQNYMDQLNYPFQQLERESGIIHGYVTPQYGTATYSNPGNGFGLAGAGIGALMSGAFGGGQKS